VNKQANKKERKEYRRVKAITEYGAMN